MSESTDDDAPSLEDLVRQGRDLLGDTGRAADAHGAFVSWDEAVADWLDAQYPGSGVSADWSSQPVSTLITGRAYGDDPSAWSLFRHSVRVRLAWLARFARSAAERRQVAQGTPRPPPSTKVFIVHGHDEGARETVARFLERLQLTPVILHEQPNKGRTIIEKFEDYADVAYAVVLLTADDVGGPREAPPGDQKPRARQNVILELGYFLGALDRSRVCALYGDGVEIPSDYSGVVFVPLSQDWRLALARELKAAGVPVDMNLAVD